MTRADGLSCVAQISGSLRRPIILRMLASAHGMRGVSEGKVSDEQSSGRHEDGTNRLFVLPCDRMSSHVGPTGPRIIN